MNEYHALFARAAEWISDGVRAGWLGDVDQSQFAAIEQAAPADLFTGRAARPLVAALFGGTGVGKSSLLNRIAGEALARTGVQRPTSREVTLYVPAAARPEKLPAALPLGSVQIREHHSDALANVAWIDAPDIDSVEESNRRLALAWLPHVDLVIYVVSPERYRDDPGWRVLQQRGGRHGWIFVMNRWDEGDLRQREDFAAILRGAEFADPLVFCTCGLSQTPRLPSPDQLDELLARVRALQSAHRVEELARLGCAARLRELREMLSGAIQRCGDEEKWEQFEIWWRSQWSKTAAAVADGATWVIQASAGRIAALHGGVVGAIRRQAAALRNPRSVEPRELTPADELAAAAHGLWDEWTEAKVRSALDQAETRLRLDGLPSAPAMAALAEPARDAAAAVTAAARDELRVALSRPGDLLQRLARRATGFLTVALPGAALAWIAYTAIVGYFNASRGQAPFLGTPFLVHSGLVMLVSWLPPFLLDRRLRPSLQRTVAGALRAALERELEEIGSRLAAAVGRSAAEAGRFRSRGESIVAAVDESLQAAAAQPTDADLTRVIRKATPVDEFAARA
ncbi:hypothetical protein RAS1_39100 [Phycisphaerae bacterium RAS1]|nr:hypothetical protein RAS1_39100 [Phycisphaerae bacterium RAS1]